MSRSFEYLDTEDLVELARRLLGEPVPRRDIGLLGAAAARPQASASTACVADPALRQRRPTVASELKDCRFSAILMI